MPHRELGSEWIEDEIKEGVCEKRLDEKKTLFIILSSISLFIILLIFLFILYMITPRLMEFGTTLFNIVIIIAVGGLLFITSYHLLLIATSLSEKMLLPFYIKNSQVLFALLYLSQRIGALLGISKDRMGNSFVKFNNSIVRAKEKKKIGDNKLLILLPRCIQHFSCKQDVIEGISNCKDCGKCIITELKRLNKDYKFHVVIATGGNLARQAIKRLKPSLVLAVACERELMTGIKDTINVPVIGVPNERDEGPCKNTKADLQEVERIISSFIEAKTS